MHNQVTVKQIELDILIEAMSKRYGMDFSNYSKASLKRRLNNICDKSSLRNLAEMIPLIIHDEKFFYSLLPEILVSVTELFRDPSFFLFFRKKIIPILETYPYIKIWHAGCATGEEVYSLAILLKECKLLDKTILYGTDINVKSLKRAKDGVLPLDDLKNSIKNYVDSGGTKNLSDYFIQKENMVKIKDEFTNNLVISSHNLVSDANFGEMHVIICRNVFIYFNKTLQNQVFKLFHDGLISHGFLCMGPKETLDYSKMKDQFKVISKEEKIYQKMYAP